MNKLLSTSTDMWLICPSAHSVKGDLALDKQVSSAFSHWLQFWWYKATASDFIACKKSTDSKVVQSKESVRMPSTIFWSVWAKNEL